MSLCDGTIPRTTLNSPRPQTPPAELENRAYARWKEDKSDALLLELLSLLKTHATRVSWIILRQNSPDFTESMALQVVCELEKFDERSQFSTWAHGIMRNLCYGERRNQKKRRETALEAARDVVVAPNFEQGVILENLLATLDEKDRQIVQLRLKGMRLEDIGKAVGMQWAGVSKRLARISKDLAK